MRIPLNAQGESEGAPVDFITGWLDGATVRGRPVGLFIQPGGMLFVTDDQAGVVYRLRAIEPQM